MELRLPLEVSPGREAPCRAVFLLPLSLSASSVVQYLPHCDPMDCSTRGFPVHHQLRSLLRLMTIKSVMPSNHLILCCPLLLLPSVFPSIRFFSNESVLRIRWPKYWSFGISLCSEYSGLICFIYLFFIFFFSLISLFYLNRQSFKYHESTLIIQARRCSVDMT